MGKDSVNILNIAFYVIFFLFTFWIGYIIIYGNGGINNRRKASRELSLLAEEIRELEEKSKMLEWEIEHLRNHKSYIESFARELGYKKEGEIIFRFMKNRSKEQ